ncbi:hypothetical protein D9758_009902 [Tetrapyrgos nigripes]|uniref:Nephrocystin 3-like N-terminal domain-containing protein n=1 Tax=Tetrapyrgos nigripes TaxID=182062 RepID=A0A8H5GN19_9AGAR|nr:hypothetical protein D9758_009902 [Tetrapyrgos nigripes]
MSQLSGNNGGGTPHSKAREARRGTKKIHADSGRNSGTENQVIHRRAHPGSKSPQPLRGFKETLESKTTQTKTQIYQPASLYWYQGSKIPIIRGKSYPGESIASERLLSLAQKLKVTIRQGISTDQPLIEQDSTFSQISENGQHSVHNNMFHKASNFQMDGATFNTAGGNISHTVNNYYNEYEPELLKVLDKLNPATKALHDVGARSTCIEGTRTEILQSIISWAENTSPDAPAGYWMCGMAGTGKSTIAKSICLKLEEKGLLAGAFFCSRQIEECKDYHRVIPTVAYQLAQYSRDYAEAIRKVLNLEPSIALKEPDNQLKKVLTKLWKGAPSSHTLVIVIDALDECENISWVLKHLIPAIKNQEFPGLKFFLTSRPEQHIKDYFDVDEIQQEEQTLQHFYLHNVQKSIVKDDISIFLQQGLGQMSISQDKMDILLERSGVLFIYAATIIKYITGGGLRAQARVANIIDLKRTPDKVETQVLDDLYSQILEEVLSSSKLSPTEHQQSLRIIYTVITTATPVSCQIISELLELALEDVQATIIDLQSVLYINQSNQAVYGFHASFADYMISETRAKNLYCNSISHHSLLAKQLRIWDVLTGDTIGKPFQVVEMVMSVAFSPDGARIAAASGDVTILNFSPDGTRIVSASSTTVMICDANTGAAIGQYYRGHQGYINSVVFSPDGSKIISGSDDQTVRIWDSSVQSVIYEPGQGHQERVYSVAFSPDGARIVSGSSDKAIRIWDASTGNAIGQPLLGHTNEVNSVALNCVRLR